MSKRNGPGELTDQQELYCREYLKDLNQTQAAIRAGYEEASARQQASRLMTKDNVASRIAELAAKRERRLEIQSDDILRELNRIGYSDIRGLLNDDGTARPVKDWPEELARAVSSIEIEEIFEGSGRDRVWTGYLKKFKFWSKDKALENLGKHKKLFTDRLEVSGKLTLEDLVTGKGEKD